MNTAPTSSQLTPSQLEACKAAVFKIADHWLALPATAILKVISLSAVSGEAEESNLMMWDGHPLVRLNLHQLLGRSTISHSLKKSPATQKYMLIVASPTGDRCAILVDELPTLLEIPLPEVQPLPPRYRQTINNIAKYMVALPFKQTSTLILLLELQQALYKKSPA